MLKLVITVSTPVVLRSRSRPPEKGIKLMHMVKMMKLSVFLFPYFLSRTTSIVNAYCLKIPFTNRVNQKLSLWLKSVSNVILSNSSFILLSLTWSFSKTILKIIGKWHCLESLSTAVPSLRRCFCTPPQTRSFCRDFYMPRLCLLSSFFPSSQRECSSYSWNWNIFIFIPEVTVAFSSGYCHTICRILWL